MYSDLIEQSKMRLYKKESMAYTDLVFRDKNCQRKWKSKMAKASELVRNMELLLVEKKYRAAATLNISRDNFKSHILKLKQRNLVFTPIKWVKRIEGFSHNHYETHPNDPDSMCYGVVTKKQKDGELFKKATIGTASDHDTIGSLLGFPKCCRNFFKEVWLAGYVDTIWHQAINSGAKITEEIVDNKLVGYSVNIEGYPQCVPMHRYWGIRYSFHLPCSFTCQHTLELSKIWEKELYGINPEAAQIIVDILSLPTTWSAHHGASIIYTPYFKGTINSVPCKKIHTVNFTALNNPVSP